MLRKKQVDVRQGKWLKVETSNLTHKAGAYGANVTNEINSVLQTIVDGMGNNLANTEVGDVSTSGLALNLQLKCPVYYKESGEAVKIGSKQVWMLQSRRVLANHEIIANSLEVGFVPHTLNPGDTVAITVDVNGGVLQMTLKINGASLAPVVTMDLNKEKAKVLYGTDGWVIVQYLGTMPADGSYSFSSTVQNTDYSYGLVYYPAPDTIEAFYSEESFRIVYALPVIARWEAFNAVQELVSQGWGNFFDVVEYFDPSNYMVTETKTIYSTNDIAPLSNPATKMIALEVNGVDLIEGDEYTIDSDGVTIVLNTANLGYDITTTDKVVAKYFVKAGQNNG